LNSKFQVRLFQRFNAWQRTWFTRSADRMDCGDFAKDPFRGKNFRNAGIAQCRPVA
jgi:hypothetical protein